MRAEIEELEEENTELTIDQVEKIPECSVNIKLYFTLSDEFPQCFISQVCLDQFKKDRPVYSCPVGHHICGDCKVNIQVRPLFLSSSVLFYLNLVKVCPTCERPVSGDARDHDFEKLVNDLWG